MDKYDDKNNVAKLNKIVFIVMIITNMMLPSSYIMMHNMGMVSKNNMMIALTAHFIAVALLIISYKKDKASMSFRYVSLISLGIIYVPQVFLSGTVLGFVSAFTVGIVYVLYLEMKVVYAVVVLIMSINTSSVIYTMCVGHMADNSPINMSTVSTQFITCVWYCVLLIYAIKTVIRYNNEKIEIVKEKAREREKLEIRLKLKKYL